ncbi:MAG: hypothetical protein ABJE47_24595 [bacterium]
MADDKSGYAHDASDRKLDKAADASREATDAHDAKATSPAHDHSATRKHDDDGKDRLFEGREQHDEAEKSSEKTRLARDVETHHHTDEEVRGDA